MCQRQLHAQAGVEAIARRGRQGLVGDYYQTMTFRVPKFVLAYLLASAFLCAPASAATGIAPAREFVPHQVVVKLRGAHRARTVTLRPGLGVRRAAAALRQKRRVAYAVPDYIATASKALPSSASIANDPGPLTVPPGPPGGWVALQWNFLPWAGPSTPELPTSPGGIDAVGAWRNLIAAGRRGASGITVAVLDTGVAYRGEGRRFRRSPDFARGQFVSGYDFVEDDRLPLDENGHGTHVAGTIAEKTDNGIGLTGLAYRAKLMPVRVLDRHGSGQADEIARGIHFAVAHGADVINMSFNFGCGKNVPGIDEELRRAYRKGVVTVASIGNLGSETCVSPPATAPRTIGVGGTTEGGCLGSYSLLPGKGTDIVAPGGGIPVPGCPSVSSRPIYQVTLKDGNTLRFGEPSSYIGTSMAAAHVSGVAAMVLASGVLKQKASPQGTVNQLTQRLRRTARSLGLPAAFQGAGLIDAARATDPAPDPSAARGR
jgi:serine protease